MLGFLGPRRLPKPRQFSYAPRYYDPRKDERRKQRLKFESHRRRGRQPAFVVMALLLLAALYLYLHLG